MSWRWLDDRKIWAETIIDDVVYSCPSDREPLASWLADGNEPSEWNAEQVNK